MKVVSSERKRTHLSPWGGGQECAPVSSHQRRFPAHRVRPDAVAADWLGAGFRRAQVQLYHAPVRCPRDSTCPAGACARWDGSSGITPALDPTPGPGSCLEESCRRAGLGFRLDGSRVGSYPDAAPPVRSREGATSGPPLGQSGGPGWCWLHRTVGRVLRPCADAGGRRGPHVPVRATPPAERRSATATHQRSP